MLLELQDIKKYFPLKRDLWGRPRTFVRAVDGVSLSLTENENLGLVGESGSGKTTLGRVILNLYRPTSGRMFLAGEEITRPGREALFSARRKMQMVFQDPYNSLDPRYTVRSSLQEALTLERPVSKPADRRERLSAILAAVGIGEDALARFPHEFSGGERQRIAIARALVMKPQLLILDEATSALDVLVQEQILRLLENLQREYRLTYLVISHDLRVVRKVCQRIAVMFKGKIVEMGPAGEIFARPLHPYTKTLIAAAVDYRWHERELKAAFRADSHLIDKGNGHFVIDY